MTTGVTSHAMPKLNYDRRLRHGDRLVQSRGAEGRLSACAPPSGSGSRSARIHTSCAVVSAPTLDLAFARWCFTVECDSPRRWAAACSDPDGNGEWAWIGPARRHAPSVAAVGG